MSQNTEHLEPVRWFLDVDGTISPFGLTKPWYGPRLLGGPPDSDLSIPYRRRLIRSIQRLHDSGHVEVVWLTTWDAEAISDWHKIGLGPFAMMQPHKAGHRWWKAAAVQTWMRQHPNRRAVWTDDDISFGGLHGLDKTRLLWIAPDPSVGLTDSHIAAIQSWVGAEDVSLR